MLRNIFWLLIGGGVVVFVIVKGRELMKRTTPAALAERADQARHSVTTRVAEFISVAREASTEREAELREALGMTEDNSVTRP